MDFKPKTTSSTDALPFFPKYDSDLICQEKLRVTWFEGDFSQSRYNFKKKNTGSNACTIIAVLMALNYEKGKFQLYGPNKRISYYVIKALAKSIIEGNVIYESNKEKSPAYANLTIPEAIRLVCRKSGGLREWKSSMYMQPLLASLYINISKHWTEWRNDDHSKRHPDLYVILVTDSKTVLFIFNECHESITLVDSHQHTSTKGAAVAVVNFQYARCLCHWFAHVLSKYYNSHPKLYELSFLYVHKKRNK